MCNAPTTVAEAAWREWDTCGPSRSGPGTPELPNVLAQCELRRGRYEGEAPLLVRSVPTHRTHSGGDAWAGL